PRSRKPDRLAGSRRGLLTVRKAMSGAVEVGKLVQPWFGSDSHGRHADCDIAFLTVNKQDGEAAAFRMSPGLLQPCEGEPDGIPGLAAENDTRPHPADSSRAA